VRGADPHAGHAAVERKVEADQRVGDPDGWNAAVHIACGVLRGVGVHRQLVVVANQRHVVQLEALHLAVQMPAFRGGVPARVP